MLRARNLILPLLLVISLAAATSTAQTPLVTRVVPEIGEPGDVISLEGFNMGTTTAVRFTANTSLGSQIINVAPSSVTTTKVTVVVPAYTTFVAANSAAGNVRCVAGAALSNFRAFFFLEQTAGQTTTQGNGSTLSTGGRPVVAFDIAGGAPTGGNSAFKLKLEAAPANSLATVVFGIADTAPYMPASDGDVVVDLTQPVVFVLNIPTDSFGVAQFSQAIPAGGPFGVTIAAQWAVNDTGNGTVQISNALVFSL